MSEMTREAELQKALDSLCQWLLHRFGPNSPEGREASVRMSAPVGRENEERIARKLAIDHGQLLYDHGSTNTPPSQYAEARWRDYIRQAHAMTTVTHD